MSWTLRFAPRAARDLNRIPYRIDDAETIVRRLIEAALNPGQADFRKLRGRDRLWRLRVGRWRAIIERESWRFYVSYREIERFATVECRDPATSSALLRWRA